MLIGLECVALIACGCAGRKTAAQVQQAARDAATAADNAKKAADAAVEAANKAAAAAEKSAAALSRGPSVSPVVAAMRSAAADATAQLKSTLDSAAALTSNLNAATAKVTVATQAQAMAAQVDQNKVNTAAAGKQTSLADYIPCTFAYSAENGFRKGEIGQDDATTQKTNALTLASNTQIVLNPKAFLDLVSSMAGTNSVLIATTAENKKLIKDGSAVQVATQLMQPIATGTPDIGCSQSVLSYTEANFIFGKAIAKAYVVIQVNTRNLNENQEFLMQDVQSRWPT